jgi:hypothetical protein
LNVLDTGAGRVLACFDIVVVDIGLAVALSVAVKIEVCGRQAGSQGVLGARHGDGLAEIQSIKLQL